MAVLDTIQLLTNLKTWILDKIGNITALIPSQASPSNQLADKAYLASQISGFITKSVNDLTYYYLKSETYTKTEVQTLISAVKQFTYQVVAQLPTASASTMNIIYLVPSADPQQQNVKDEFITIQSGSTYSWEQIGSTAIDLSGYYTSAQTDAAITAALNAALASYYTSTQVDAAITTALGSYYTKTQADAMLAEKEAVANKVTTIDGDSTDTQYPSAKAVHGFVEDEIDDAKEDIDTKLDGKANNDGYYGEMTVGSAENLVGRGTVEAEYNGVRTTAGTEDIGSGSATITKHKGNSVKFNQLFNKSAYTYDIGNVYGAGVNEKTEKANSVAINAANCTIISGHKYILDTNLYIRRVQGIYRGDNGLKFIDIYLNISNTQPQNIFLTAQRDCESIHLSLQCEQGNDGTMTQAIYDACQYNVFDLTQIFGAGNEPATVEEFEEWLATNLGKRDYYPYNAGAILNNGAAGIKTRGFNLYDYATGKAYLCGKYSDYEWEYEICGTFESISYTDVNGNTYVPELHDGRFFNVENAGELTVVGGNNTDTLVHMVWSGWRNEGEPDYQFEPYWESLLQLNLKTITGKLNGTGESQVIFPYGLAKIGSVQDEIVGDTATKRIDRRAYEQGDESDSTVMTDGTNTQYVLSTPEIYTLDEELPMNYRVDDFGTEEAEPAYTDELNANIRYDVQYAMNAVDAIRRLPTNYVQREDVKQMTGKSEKFVLSQKAVDENYAKKVGIEKDLTVGSAMNLQGDDVNNDNDIYRKTGGNNSVGTGIAQIEGAKGNTVVWNQMSTDAQMIISNSTLSYANGYTTAVLTNGTTQVRMINSKVQKDLKTGDKVLVLAHFKNYNVANADFSLVKVNTAWNAAKNVIACTGATEFRGNKVFALLTVKNASVGENIGFYLDLCGGGSFETTTADTFTCSYNIFNLTRMFGAGNEPSTEEEFEADYFKWFGKPLTYEPYDAGSLRPTMIDGLKITGFNQYNPESGLLKAMVGEQYQITGTYSKVWESEKESMSFSEYTYGNEFESDLGYSVNGAYYISKRKASAYSNEETYRLNSYCIHENQVYKCNTAIDTAEEWDATKWDLIADVAAMVTEGIFVPMDITPDSNGIFTPSKFYVHVEGGNATDTCVHLVGNGARNGEYEQYKEQNISIPVTTLTGKLNGEGESVVVFPDGMKRVRDVADEIVIRNGKTVAIKRIYHTTFDGSENWSYGASTYRLMQGQIYPTPKAYFTTGGKRGLGNSSFWGYSINSNGVPGENSWAVFTPWNGIIVLFDMTLIGHESLDVEAWKQWLATQYQNGHPLMIEYIIEEQEYVLDDFQLPISIQADALGTEEQTVPSGVASAPATIGIKYAIDAVGFILNAPKNYISEQSMDNFLSQLGTAMGGTWSKTWNESSGEYDFSFTPNVEPEPEENNG